MIFIYYIKWQYVFRFIYNKNVYILEKKNLISLSKIPCVVDVIGK